MQVTLLEGFENMQMEEATALLQTSNWSPGIGLQEVVQATKNSALVVGAFVEGRQVGFLRVISDKTRFAYFNDVIVNEQFRHRGIATQMVNYALRHETLKDVYQWMLRTTYARGFYETLGFAELPEPEKFMAIFRPRPDR